MRTSSPVLVALLVVGCASAADWARFRGPNGAGVAEAKRLPVEFGPAKNVVWKTALPPGHSSPIIAGDRIYLTAGEGGQREDAGREKIVDSGGKLYTFCLQRRNGEILWKRETPRPRLERYQPTNSPASPSPVTDGSSVYVFFGDFGLLSYTRDGRERWRLSLGPFNNVNGHGSSPILVGQRLILLCDQDTDSYLLAVDKDTGRVLWKTPRPEVTRSYTTPAVLTPARGPAELIIPSAYQLTSYSVDNGEKLWWVRGVSWQPKSTPIIDGDMIYAHWWEYGGENEQVADSPTFAEMLAKLDTDKDGRLSQDEFVKDPKQLSSFTNNDLGHDGYLDEHDWENFRARRSSRNSLLAIRHGGRGDLTDSNVVWRMQKFLPNVPSPLLYNGVLYLIKDGGILTAVNPKSGEILRQGRLMGALDTYYASPVAGAGLVYLLSQAGKASVLKAGAQWEVLALNDLGEECYATPAIVDDKLYLRTRTTLYCFAEQGR